MGGIKGYMKETKLYNVFKKQIEDKKLKFKIAITIAIITIPWTFLLPTKWFY